MSNINQYPNEAFQINDEDFYDVDYWNGVSYETRKISGATLKAAIAAGVVLALDDLTDVTTGLPITPTNADDGRLLYFDIDSGQWISDDIATISNVVKDCKTSVATGSIPKGRPVYLAGFDNDLLVVEECDASDPNKMPCIGVTAEALDDTNAKKVISFGKLQGVDTSVYANGDELYVAVGGGFTTTRPTGSAEIQRVAVVLKSDNPGGLMKVFNTSRTAGLPNLPNGLIWQGDVNGYPQAVSLPAGVNIYNADGVISGPRIVDIGGQSLVFNDSSALDGPLVQLTQFLTKLAWTISPTAGDENSVYCTATLICIYTANAAVPIELLSDIIKLSNKTSGVSAIMDTSVMATDRTFTWQDQSGTIALLSDIVNIFNSDGSLTADRFLSGAGFSLNLTGLNNLLQQVGPATSGVPAWELDVDTSAMAGGDQLWKLRDTTAGVDVLQYLKSGVFVINNAYALPAVDGNPGEVMTTDGAGNVTFQPSSGGEKHIDTFYAYDMSQANGYTWNGANVATTVLGTINDGIRVQVMAGLGGADGVFVNSSMPLYYVPGQDIKVTLNSTHPGTGGDYVLFCGIQENRPGGLVGDETSTLWSATGPITASVIEEAHSNTITFAGSLLTNLNPGDAIVIKIYRDPGDPLDTYTGDVYLQTIGIEIA